MEFKLIIKKLNNTLTEKESIIFSEWYNGSNLHRDYFKKVKLSYDNQLPPLDIEKSWQKLEKQIKSSSQKNNNYLKYAIAASIILFVSLSFFFKNEDPNHSSAPVIVNNNIKIGTDKATLTLENGTNVTLEKGQNYTTNNITSNGEEIIYQSPSATKKEIAFNYLTIPRGGQYYVKLEDGTQVWLNSESKLKYPVNFIDGSPRQVELVYGEAYFDVSPSTKHQGDEFIVKHHQQNVKVLGTEFNIKAYNDESEVYTTLVEGKVAIANSIKSMVLKPNEQSITKTYSDEINIIPADVYAVTSWRKGIFSFDNMELEKIMKVLARWYDFDIVFVNSNLKKTQFTGVLRKHQNIEEILETIRIVNNIAYEINDNTVIFR